MTLQRTGIALGAEAVIGVIGAGAMGAGIAQVAAAAGHPVRLYDVAAGAAELGKGRIATDLAKLVARGKISSEAVDALCARITAAPSLDTFSDCALVVEAVVENLEVKRDLIAQLEAVAGPDAILASNTSSLSITAIARGAKHPGRIVGMHFFNPAPVMKLVEVVSGALSAADTASRVFATAEAWGKVAVHARSTPGFIVNRVARPFYAEALRLHEEQMATPATIDALMTEGGGFRMGPFALMDLIGHDVNYAVTKSVFEAYYHDPRFRPSLAQLELVDAGLLGRKSGRGFYDYGSDAVPDQPATELVRGDIAPTAGFTTANTTIDGTLILLTDGRSANDRAASEGAPVILCDLMATGDAGRRQGFAASDDVSNDVIERFAAELHAQGIAATRLPDRPGLIVMRTVAMLANEAFEAVLHGVGDEAGIDAAMRHGVNYPRGPMGWARDIGLTQVLSVIDELHHWTGDQRYRASTGLRMAAREA